MLEHEKLNHWWKRPERKWVCWIEINRSFPWFQPWSCQAMDDSEEVIINISIHLIHSMIKGISKSKQDWLVWWAARFAVIRSRFLKRCDDLSQWYFILLTCTELVSSLNQFSPSRRADGRRTWGNEIYLELPRSTSKVKKKNAFNLRNYSLRMRSVTQMDVCLRLESIDDLIRVSWRMRKRSNPQRVLTDFFSRLVSTNGWSNETSSQKYQESHHLRQRSGEKEGRLVDDATIR